jgi:hypothetical protein
MNRRANDPKPRWPRHAWANAFAIREGHELEMTRIHNDAMTGASKAAQGRGPSELAAVAWRDAIL